MLWHIKTHSFRKKRPLVGLMTDLGLSCFCVAMQQELIDEGLHEWHLAFGQHAMGVSANDAIVHAVLNAELLPHLFCRLSGRQHRLVGEPLVVGVAQQQQGTRTHHCAELMMVVGQLVDAVAVEVLAHRLHEPVVVGVVEVFHLRECVADAPGCSTAAARLLGNG